MGSGRAVYSEPSGWGQWGGRCAQGGRWVPLGAGEHGDGEQDGFPRNCFASRFWQPPDGNRPDEAFGVKTQRGLDPAGSSRLLSCSPLPPGKVVGFFFL